MAKLLRLIGNSANIDSSLILFFSEYFSTSVNVISISAVFSLSIIEKSSSRSLVSYLFDVVFIEQLSLIAIDLF